MEEGLALMRRLLRDSQQAASSQISQISSCSQRGGTQGGTPSCAACGSSAGFAVDGSGHVVCVDCGGEQEGELLASAVDGEEAFEVLATGARLAAATSTGGDSLTSALSRLSGAQAEAERGKQTRQTSTFSQASSSQLASQRQPRLSSLAAVALDADAIDREEEADERTARTGEGADIRLLQAIPGEYWQQPLLLLTGQEAAGLLLDSDGAPSNAALIRCWVSLLQSTCRHLQEVFGLSDLLELEALKVVLQYFTTLARFRVPVETFFCEFGKRSLKVPITRVFSHSSEATATLRLREEELLKNPQTPEAVREIVRFMGLDRVAYVRRLLPSASLSCKAFSRGDFHFAARAADRQTRDASPLRGSLPTEPRASGSTSVGAGEVSLRSRRRTPLPLTSHSSNLAPYASTAAVASESEQRQGGRVAGGGRSRTLLAAAAASASARGGFGDGALGLSSVGNYPCDALVPEALRLPPSSEASLVWLPLPLVQKPPASVASRVAESVGLLRERVPRLQQEQSRLLALSQECRDGAGGVSGDFLPELEAQQIRTVLAAETAAAVFTGRGNPRRKNSQRRKKALASDGALTARPPGEEVPLTDSLQKTEEAFAPDRSPLGVPKYCLRLLAHERGFAIGAAEGWLEGSVAACASWRPRAEAEMVDAIYEHDFLFLLLALEEGGGEGQHGSRKEPASERPPDALALASLDSVLLPGCNSPDAEGRESDTDSDDLLPLSVVFRKRRLAAATRSEAGAGGVGGEGEEASSVREGETFPGFPRGTRPLSCKRFCSAAHSSFFESPPYRHLALGSSASEASSQSLFPRGRPDSSCSLSPPPFLSSLPQEANPNGEALRADASPEATALLSQLEEGTLQSALFQTQTSLCGERGEEQPADEGSLVESGREATGGFELRLTDVDGAVSVWSASSGFERREAQQPEEGASSIEASMDRSQAPVFVANSQTSDALAPAPEAPSRQTRLRRKLGVLTRAFDEAGKAVAAASASQRLAADISVSTARETRVVSSNQASTRPSTRRRQPRPDNESEPASSQVDALAQTQQGFEATTSVSEDVGLRLQAFSSFASDPGLGRVFFLDATDRQTGGRRAQRLLPAGPSFFPARSPTAQQWRRRLRVLDSSHQTLLCRLGAERRSGGDASGETAFPAVSPRWTGFVETDRLQELSGLSRGAFQSVFGVELGGSSSAEPGGSRSRVSASSKKPKHWGEMSARVTVVRLAWRNALLERFKASTAEPLVDENEAGLFSVRAFEDPVVQALSPHALSGRSVNCGGGKEALSPSWLNALLNARVFSPFLPATFPAIDFELLLAVLLLALRRCRVPVPASDLLRFILQNRLATLGLFRAVPPGIWRQCRAAPHKALFAAASGETGFSTLHPQSLPYGAKVVHVLRELEAAGVSAFPFNASAGVARLSAALRLPPLVSLLANAVLLKVIDAQDRLLREKLRTAEEFRHVRLPEAPPFRRAVRFPPLPSLRRFRLRFAKTLLRLRKSLATEETDPRPADADAASLRRSPQKDAADGGSFPVAKKRRRKRAPREELLVRRRGPPRLPWSSRHHCRVDKVSLSPSGFPQTHSESWRILAPRSVSGEAWGSPLELAAGASLLVALRLLFPVMQWHPPAAPVARGPLLTDETAATQRERDADLALRLIENFEKRGVSEAERVEEQAQSLAEGSSHGTAFGEAEKEGRRQAQGRVPVEALRFATKRFLIFLDGDARAWVVGIRDVRKEEAENERRIDEAAEAVEARPSLSAFSRGVALKFFTTDARGDRRAGRQAIRYLVYRHLKEQRRQSPDSARDPLLPPQLLRLFSSFEGGDVSTLLEFLKTSEATAADADSGGASGASESLSSEALVSYADAPENASSLRQTQVRLVDELRIREEAFLKPCCQSASEAFRELRSDRWSCQVPPPLAPLVAVESEGEEEGEARQSAEAQNPKEDKNLRLLRRRASRQLLCEAAVERLRKTLPSNRELFARLLSPAVSTGSASARLQLPALGEGDSTVYLDRALSSKSWLLDSLHGRAQALRAAESLLLSRPLHTNARDAVAAARSGEARRRERFEREAGRRTAQSGKEKLQEENSDDEDEGAEDAFGVPLDLDEVRASQGSPFAEAAAQLEAALKSATQTVGLLGVHEQALYAEELSALFQRKRLKGASGVQRKTRGAAPTPSAASPSAVSESEGEGELESEYASECLSEDDAFDCLAAAAEASCPVVLIPLQPPEAEQVRAFVEAHESLLDELLQDAEKGEPISFEKVVDEEMRAVARSRLQWLGSPNVAYDGSASDFMHLLYSSLLNQFGVEDPLQSETPPAAAETHNAAETDECVLAKVLASTEEDKFSFPRCAQTPPPASLAGAVQRILTVLEKESGCAFEEEGRSHPQDFAESQLQRLPQEIRGEAVETEGEPEAEGGSAANRPSEARGAEVWNLKAFLGGAREGAFKLRPSTNAFSEAAGGGAGRALPLRLESACSFATSRFPVAYSVALTRIADELGVGPAELHSVAQQCERQIVGEFFREHLGTSWPH